MLDLEEAKQKCEEACPEDDITQAYQYMDKYYFDLKPKNLPENGFYDSAMCSIDKNTGQVAYLNFVELIMDGTADKLQKL